MSKNIDQVYITNPITSNTSTDLMYFGQSPYTPGDDAAMTYANFAAQFANPGINTNIHSMTGLTGVLQAPTFINDPNGNHTLQFSYVSSAVNYFNVTNTITGDGPELHASGSDPDININLFPKGAGKIVFDTAALTNPFVITSGTGSQHDTNFNFPNTNATQNVTFQDASGTLAYLTDIPSTIAITNITGLGTGVESALTTNIGNAGATVLFNGAGGTPSSMVGTNITGTAAGLTAGTASAVAVGGITGLGTGVGTALAANVTGSGGIALATSPTFTTPTLGAALATSVNFGGTTLSAYAQGSWTPIDSSGASLTFSTATGSYTRIGNIVIASCEIVFPATVSSAGILIGGLPFTANSSQANQGGSVQYCTASTIVKLLTLASSTTFEPYTAAQSQVLNSAMSGGTIICQLIYLL